MAARQPTKCLDCGRATGQGPRLIFAAKTFKGSNILCWECLTQAVGEYSGCNLALWMPDYIKAHTDPLVLAKETIQEQQRQIERLLKERDDLRRLNSDGRYRS